MKKKGKQSVQQFSQLKFQTLDKKQMNQVKGGEDHIGIIDVVDG